MADKKRMKQRKLEEEKPTKEEYAVAKYLRFNLPPKEGKLHGMEVQCFLGNAAVDKLLESKWSAEKKAKEPLFFNRVSCVAYMLRLLEKGLFHRAERDKKKKDKEEKDKPKKKKKEKEEKEDSTPAEDKVRERQGKKSKKGKAVEETETKSEADKKEDKEKKDEKKKKEKRLKLVMPDQQFFEDSDEVYVWIYDPVKPKNFIIGLLMVLGAIALCMFPLWPSEVRLGVYYLSLSAAGFVGFILSLVVIRLILFCCVWVVTLGRHHFWFLPNLTEDVGFFDSFKPLYKHDYVPGTDSSGDKKKGKSKNKSVKDKTSKDKSSDKDDSDEFEVIKKEDLVDNGGDEDKDLDEGEEDDIGADETDQNGAEDEEEEEEYDNDEEEGENIDDDDDYDESEEGDQSERKKTN